MTEVTSLLLVLSGVVGHAWVAAATSASCGPDAKPHPQGICGSRLAEVRERLCMLLAQDYPDRYGKRSAPEFALADPLQDDEENDAVSLLWDLNPRGPESEASWTDLLFHHPRALHPLPGSDLKQAALENPSHLQLQKRSGIVCECCFNQCRPSILARYC